MSSNLELLDQIQEYTANHRGIAVKASAQDGASWVYADGEEKHERGGAGRFKVTPGGENYNELSQVLTAFWVGEWDEKRTSFLGRGEALSEVQLRQLLKAKR
ncbi:MAG: hypothetical protein A2620_05800 [Acidobacteria bacterium RIFCSPHIGHO2_01_FULL_67_28]|nr:MAG: hypothetical protein A2620_05800 [Acidobacteria bacterium RIFCSPHIGHO2_01_FULL_67_28]